MKLRLFYFFLLCFSYHASSFAASLPPARIAQPAYSDTTLTLASVLPTAAPQSKKAGFLTRVKNKVLGFFVKKELQNLNKKEGNQRKFPWVLITVLLVVIGGLFILMVGLPYQGH